MADQSPSSGLPKATDTPSWSLQNTADGVCLNVEGAWTVQAGGTTPFPQDKLPVEPGHTLHIDATGLKSWDSAFVAFLWDVKQAASKAQLHFDEQGLPASAQRLLALLPDAPAEPAQPPRNNEGIFARVGDITLNGLTETGTVSELALDTAKGAAQAVRGKSAMRMKDLLLDIWNAGPDALLIVGIVNFLVGAILAFVGLVELRKFAAEIYVTDLVGIACAREISAIMTAIIMAGRTGGAYAARISTMLGNEEIDALQVFGIPISSYILLPSILSLALMMPLLYLYGTIVAIFGGFAVSMSMMDVSPIGYWISTFDGVELKEFIFGFIKSFFFASFIALAACRVGLKAGRSAADVGIAATRAVVIGIVGIIAMDAIFAVIANALGI
ncbi:ABC transporter permease [Acetobacter ascendens]|uniref:ABC transporter permease n=1 Tax=Acetobacter ascendens TaxID=481146 RepID=A0A1D8QZ78_9PROT|nr:ABC transporter permease [Acetobacter ascendens]AOW47653.1 ABC transporter permease [Acetobacter ascendens]AOW48899.1 ABC transporter permease [Acetobacter ascendens]ARW10581.1 Protein TRIGALACTOSYLDIACYLGLYCEROL 1, chloroplastic [Acetobacter ascendens]GCD76002.1 ABC transporter permease [Acetobacter pasteurianus NBRC 3299]